MWNMRLFKALGSKVGIKGKDAKREAEWLGLKYDLSPSAFDVTFAIGADRCSEKDCKRCPFGDNALCHKGKERNCSIVNWLNWDYEYEYPCDFAKCPIGKDFGKSLCSRKIEGKISH
jgi:hypothetical protein